MKLNQLQNDYLLKRKHYFFYIISAFINGFLFSLGYVISINFFRENDPHIYIIFSSFTLTLILFFLSINNFEGFFEYSISGILVYSKKYRFSLYLLRIIGIYFSTILGIIFYTLLFYFSKIWIFGSSPENIALKIASYFVKTTSIPIAKYIILSFFTGIFTGFIFYCKYFIEEHKNDLRLFLTFFIYAIFLSGSFFINFYIELINSLFVYLIKNNLVEIGLVKFKVVNFDRLLLNLFLSSFFNFLGIFIFTLPLIYIYEKFKNKEVE
jgi:formate/nitrite transporter FocA (FNT family)